MSRTVVHMIGQAHLDPAWLWRWREGRAEALATSQSAVDRLREYPDFQFVRGEAQVYEWIEEENPELFGEILGLIREGRWHVVNGMIIQPDVNLPQGEALVRQVLLGKTYMRERLGVEPRVAYCVDSFGHQGTLPQILAKCGFDSYVFMRPGPHEKELPANVFWWEAPDGSRVLAFRIAGAYATRAEDLTGHIETALQAKPAQLSQTMCFFGVGDHGGGPTRRQIENVMHEDLVREDVEVRFGSPAAYFAAVRPEAGGLPVVRDELHAHAPGCYSVVSALKRTYRLAECALLTAERMAALAQIWLPGTPSGHRGRPAPMAQLDALWHELCFLQFHDILCGTCIKEAQDEAVMALGRVLVGAREITDDACRAIVAQVDTFGAGAAAVGSGGAVVLFNPGGEPLTQYVEYEPWTDWRPWAAEGWGLADEQGRPVPYQLIETHEALTSQRSGLNRIVFRAEVPATGYRVYRFAPGAAQAALPEGTRVTPDGLENERLAVRLDPASGAIISCADKTSGIELVGPGGWNVAQVLEDTSDTWSHGVRCFENVIGTFGQARITAGEPGPLQASLLIERSYEGNTWLQELILRHGEDELLVRNWLTWAGRWRMLKLAFDVPTTAPRAVHDVPFGWYERPCDGREVPTQMWMDVSGPAAVGGQPAPTVGLALINDGKYGCDVTAPAVMRLTVLRCPPYAYHMPHPFGRKQRYDWIDQGQQEFELVLRPHVGDWRNAGIVKRAREFNLPPVAITSHCHGGARAASDSLLELTGPEIEMTALKPAQDGDGYIVRLADRHGRGGKAGLRCGGQDFTATVAPSEVLTLRLRAPVPAPQVQASDDGGWQMAPCDMLERELALRRSQS
jgi:alpha-mannosidase